MKIILTISVLHLSASALLGQDIALEDGQKLFTYGWEDQRVRTSDFEAVLSFEGQDDQPTYRIEMSEPATGILTAHTFPQEPGQLELTAFNRVKYCGEDVIFLTVRYSPPRFADIKQFRFETLAFHADTLLHQDSAPVAFEAIALQEIGFDIGWPYTAPQSYQVRCEPRSKKLAFQLVEGSETP